MSDETIEVAQHRLAITVARAQAEEDRELGRLVREQGAALASAFNGLLRMARTHGLSNAAFNNPVRDFQIRLRELLDLLGPIHVICVEDQVYVNDIRVRFEAVMEQTVVLPAELRRHNAGGISFYTPLEDPEIRDLIRLLGEPPAEESPRTALQDRLVEARMSTVELHPPQHFRVSGEERHEVDQEFRDAYLSSVGVVAEAFASLGSGKLPNPLQARRIVTRFVDAAKTDDLSSTARESDEMVPGFSRHTLMVTSLSLLIGRAIGLGNASLADLGVAAIYHDIGFCMTEEGYTVPFERHTRAGLRVLLSQRGFYVAKVRRMLGIIEHHRRWDDARGTPFLYSRILHIADDFDILTRYRPGRGPVCSLPDAVARMAAQSGRAYDPELLQAFINTVGPFPPGSLLRLEDGRVVVSVSGVRSPQTFATPLARVVRDAGGGASIEQPFVDLASGPRVTGVLRPGA